MSCAINKKHWYDGWIYAKIIDTNQLPFRNKILEFLNKDKTVLDVGCGTGGFTLEIAKNCKLVVGIDVSGKQIQQANLRLLNSNTDNVEFKHVHASQFSKEPRTKFDFAVFTFMLHEISQEERITILKDISKLANTLIILEYNVPHPYNFWGIGSRVIEFAAGWSPFSNFLDFGKRGGINNILKDAGFQILEEKINRKNIFKIVIATKKDSSV